MAKERMVTRKVIESKKYNVYKVEGTELKFLETIETKGRPSERELEKKHNVEKVVCTLVDEKKAVYGMPVSQFMEGAKFIKYEEPDKVENEESENN